MSVQIQRIYQASITTGNSLSSSIDLGGGYLYVSVEIPSNTSAYATMVGSPIWIQGSSDNVNFRRFYEVYTNAVASAFQIQSSVCNAIVPLNLFNCRYVRLEVSGTVTGGGQGFPSGTTSGSVGFKVICTDSL